MAPFPKLTIFLFSGTILVCLLLGLISPASAASPAFIYLPIINKGCGSVYPFYISSSGGSDSNSGTDYKHPLKTIAKLSTLPLLPGDQVLFICGDTWRGESLPITQSGAPGNPITYSSFPPGCANQPVLDGTQVVSGWSLYAPHIYVSDLGTGANQARFTATDGTLLGISQLFRDGKRLTMGHWPNLDAGDGGYSAVNSQPGARMIADTHLPPNNWTGATIHLKVMRWSMVNRDVIASSSGNLTLNSDLACWGGSCAGWGYFINNSLNTLDQDGEWYYDKITRKVYLYSSLADPSSALIEGSVVFHTNDRNWGGVTIEKDLADPVHDVVVNNLAIRGWFENGISSPTNLHPDENSAITLSQNSIRDVDGSGINLWSWVWGAGDGEDGWRGGHKILIQNNLIDGANSFGIHTPSRDTIIKYNTIRNIGLIANFNEAGMGCGKTGNEGTCTEDGAGLRIYVDRPDRSGYGFTVRNNRFEQIGYNGIQTFDGSSVFSGNYFDHTCISKGDGGAINTFGGGTLASSAVHDISILGNIIVNTIGNTDGTQAAYRLLFGFGIYLNNGSANITTSGNTVAFSSAAGILYQNATGSVVNNILYQNVTGTGWNNQVVLTGSQTVLSAFNSNILVSANDHSRNLSLSSLAMIAAADYNYYYHTLNSGWQVVLAGQDYGLVQWRAASMKDINAQTGGPAYASTLQLFTNDTTLLKTISSSTGTYRKLAGTALGSSFTLPPFSSLVVSFVPN